jgi:hypothetical protein
MVLLGEPGDGLLVTMPARDVGPLEMMPTSSLLFNVARCRLMMRCEEKCRSQWRGEEVGDGCTLLTPNLVMANFLCRGVSTLRKHITHILDRDTIYSRSSVFTLGSQVIALPFPAFSEYLHLQLESGMEVHGRAESDGQIGGLEIQRLTSFVQTLQSFFS